MKISKEHAVNRLADNMQKAAILWPQVIQAMAKLDSKSYMTEEQTVEYLLSAFAEYYNNILQKDPALLVQQQFQWWQHVTQIWQSNMAQFLKMGDDAQQSYFTEGPKDRRFRSELWEKNCYFNAIRQQYLLTSKHIQQLLNYADDKIDPHKSHLVKFYTKQWVDALSPSNYPWSNPEVLQEVIASDGENLVRGLENLLHDLQNGAISMTPNDAFQLGENIAYTKGKVIFENQLMQLIQYEPTTKQVYERPLLIIPAWINKYYILDLQEDNSLVRWLVNQGYTVFIISWVNPDSSHRECSFDDYMLQGAYKALQVVRQIVGDKYPVHVAGYCLGGTLLSCLLSWLHSKKRQEIVASATFLTTLVDFEQAGDMKVFIDEPQISALEKRMEEKGYLDGHEMALTFTMLRPVDLIWSFVVNNYLLGRDPKPFDLLYWNADSTRMPAKMHSFYLRQMYLYNKLAKPNELEIGGEKIDLRQIATECYLLATKEDHIAPWKAVYAATRYYRGNIRFVLAGSGHVAGVINSPSRGKYGYWVRKDLPPLADDWLHDAIKKEGSWWLDWGNWLEKRSGGKVAARKVGASGLQPIEDAPGSYVRARG